MDEASLRDVQPAEGRDDLGDAELVAHFAGGERLPVPVAEETASRFGLDVPVVTRTKA